MEKSLFTDFKDLDKIEVILHIFIIIFKGLSQIVENWKY
jgi:hypothetical protein